MANGAMGLPKGRSGNPSGKRKEARFYTALDMELRAVEANDQRGLRRIARTLIERAEQGEPWAIREIADRMDGKPAQSLDHGISLGDDLADLLRSIDGSTRGLPNR